MGSLAAVKRMSLCLCFVASAGSYTSQIVRSIRLKSFDDNDDDFELLPEPEVAYKSSSTVYKSWSFSTRFGPSRIVLPTGTDEHRITHFRLLEFLNSSNKTKLHQFSSPKNDPLLGELNGKLYCIDNAPYLKDSGFSNTLPPPGEESKSCEGKKEDCSGHDGLVRGKLLRSSKLGEKLIDRKVQPFEFLDITENTNSLEWVPLEHPPFINGFSPNDFVVSFLEGSNKILGWERDEVGVYCFDTNNPENGWAESSSSLSNALPFLVRNRTPPLFIRDHHPDIGDFHLTFIYDPKCSLVTACFMSGKCDNFHTIKYSPLQVPNFYDGLDYEFVHLGDKKVCLVLNKFFPHDHHGQLKNTGIVLVVNFEYKFVPKVFNYGKPIIYINPRLLGTQRFRYHSRQLHKTGCRNTDSVHMSGVFLF